MDDHRCARAGRRPVRRRRPRVAHRVAAPSPTPTRPIACGNSYLDAETITAHLMACTEAGITAGFHVIGDAAVTAVVDALQRVVDRFGAPAVARCGHRLEHLEMVTAEQAGRLGRGGCSPACSPISTPCGVAATACTRSVSASTAAMQLNPLALLASQGVPLAFGSDSPVTSMNPWSTVRAATRHQTPGSAVSMRAAFAAATRGGLARRRRARRRHRHPRARCARVVCGMGRRRLRGQRAG